MRYLCVLLAACVISKPQASAFRVERQNDLIGGPQALGQVGDYKLQNGKIQVIVQDAGLSRGFGVYGGSLIDADIKRPGDFGQADGGHGNDRFAEMFSAFFLQAVRPTKVAVTNDGTDGKPAVVLVSGDGGPFLTQANLLNSVAIGDGYKYSIEYSLGPNDAFVKVKSSIINTSGTSRNLVAPIGGGFPIPFGSVALFGATNKVFIPGVAGYDLRYTLPELSQKVPRHLPALPGIVTDLIATSGDGVSYGVFAEENPDTNFAYRNRDQYGDGANPGSLQVPFFFSSFIGYYYGVDPEPLANNATFSYTQYFAVGKGDVASIRDIYNGVRGTQTGTFSGRVRDSHTLRGLAGLHVIVYNATGPFNQHTTDELGDFAGSVPPGDYEYEIVSDSKPASGRVAFHVDAGKTTAVEPLVAPGGVLTVTVTDTAGTRVPAKVMVIGTHDANPDPEPRHWLFDFKKGERRRQIDQAPDTDDPSTRRYLESQFWTANGQIGEEVRPGHYTVMVGRGTEYETPSFEVDLREGEQTTLSAVLERVVDSKGYVSGDLHLHSSNSIDADEAVDSRVVGCAAEGLDFAVATDHNYVTDYSPYVAQHNLQQFLMPIVGLEMTTLELGHFNAYPLKYDVKYANRGPIKWFDRTAQEVFNDLRDMGKYSKEDTIVQVNHPRDTILGYFNDINLSADDDFTILPRVGLLTPQGRPFDISAVSYDFDALEIFNGKRWDLLRTIRAPNPLPPPPYVLNTVNPGDILRYPVGSSGEPGKIAYPGAVDDWFKLLNRGYRFTGTANSDSHDNSKEEPGTPRTYVNLGVDDPFEIRDLDIARAIKAHKATLTNGPFVEMWLNETPIGGEIQGVHSAALRVRIQKPSWVHIERLNVYVNGEMDKSFMLRDINDETIEADIAFARDAYVVAEVTGERVSLWPMVTGWEDLPLTLGDALRDLAGPLGISFDSLGNLQPYLAKPVYPYAVTNPIWIDYEGDQVWSPPGNAATATRDVAAPPQASDIPPPGDIRALFKLFGGHH